MLDNAPGSAREQELPGRRKPPPPPPSPATCNDEMRSLQLLTLSTDPRHKVRNTLTQHTCRVAAYVFLFLNRSNGAAGDPGPGDVPCGGLRGGNAVTDAVTLFHTLDTGCLRTSKRDHRYFCPDPGLTPAQPAIEALRPMP